MPELYKRYQEGQYQEVYDELLSMQEKIYHSDIYEEALLVMRTMMRRVQFNIKQIVTRLHQMGYLFYKEGFWNNFPSEEKVNLGQEYPIFQPPTPKTLEQVVILEQLAGPLPLSLKCWYEEVGNVNLIGLFPSSERDYGRLLDPLYVNTVEIALQMVTNLKKLGLWEEEQILILAPDSYHKYGYSGSGSYNIQLPLKAIDALLLNEPHNTTFVNYLRTCIRWGGFPGLENENHLSKEDFDYLTNGLLPF